MPASNTHAGPGWGSARALPFANAQPAEVLAAIRSGASTVAGPGRPGPGTGCRSSSEAATAWSRPLEAVAVGQTPGSGCHYLRCD
jgi:hypothetical protein